MIRPRLLPLTIIVIFVLLVEKTATLIGEAVAGTPAVAAPQSPGTPTRYIANWDSTQPPPAICKPDSTVNPNEVAVLSALRKRSQALDARETTLDRKQALVEASEQNLSSQLAGLKAVESRLSALSQTESQAADNRWQALVATYQAMEPAAAAGIFNGLNMNVLLPVLTRMNSRKAAVVLAAMAPDKARQATELMAGQGQDITLGNPASPVLP